MIAAIQQFPLQFLVGRILRRMLVNSQLRMMRSDDVQAFRVLHLIGYAILNYFGNQKWSLELGSKFIGVQETLMLELHQNTVINLERQETGMTLLPSLLQFASIKHHICFTIMRFCKDKF